FLWTGIVPSLWEFVWNVSRNGICLYYYLVYPSLGRLYFTHNSGWHQTDEPKGRENWKKFLINVKGSWKRSLIVFLCILLVLVRMFWPHMEIDAISLWFLGIAAFILLVPELRIFIPYIKGVKFGQAELQLRRLAEIT
ncbi:MAG TPA: hypothetical protein VEP90_07005, partial [Methylomirabilota bacterium]|nr:hypothetical protein [Methylomirabilota bacterium]